MKVTLSRDDIHGTIVSMKRPLS